MLRLLSIAISFLTGGCATATEATRLAEASERAIAVALDPGAVKFAYLTPVTASPQAFFLAGKRVPFAGAGEARLLAPNNHGDCAWLFIHGGALYRLGANQGVEPVASSAEVASLAAISTGDAVLAPRYFKDAQGVSFYDLEGNAMARLEGARPATFRAFAASYGFALHGGLDAGGVFVGALRVPRADPATFQYVGWVYGKDQHHVFVLTGVPRVLEGADAATFDVVKGRGIDARDAKRAYSMGEPLQGPSRGAPGDD